MVYAKIDGTHVYGLIMVVVCSARCLWHGYGCGLFHSGYGMVMVVVCSTVVMEWLQLLWNGYGHGMFHGCNDMVVVCSTRVG